jgi:hypothetical protein
VIRSNEQVSFTIIKENDTAICDKEIMADDSNKEETGSQ